MHFGVQICQRRLKNITEVTVETTADPTTHRSAVELEYIPTDALDDDLRVVRLRQAGNRFTNVSSGQIYVMEAVCSRVTSPLDFFYRCHRVGYPNPEFLALSVVHRAKDGAYTLAPGPSRVKRARLVASKSKQQPVADATVGYVEVALVDGLAKDASLIFGSYVYRRT